MWRRSTRRALAVLHVSAPEEFVPLVFAVGCCGPVVVLVAELELLPLLSPFVLVSPLPPWLVLPAELLDGAGVCCGAGGGLAGGRDISRAGYAGVQQGRERLRVDVLALCGRLRGRR